MLDVRTKDPDLSRMSGEAEISLLATKAALNVPIVKNKLGITAAGRISNYSLINLISLTDLMKGTKIGLHFADLNTSLLYQPTGRDEIKLSYFRNSDGLNIKQQEGTTTTHEFAHLITTQTRGGKTDEIKQFWTDVREIKREYHGEIVS